MNKKEIKRTVIEQEFTDYVRDLGEVLKTFDPCEFRTFFQKYRNWIPDADFLMVQSDDFLTGLLCKMILARNDMTPAERQKARAELDDLNWNDD